MPFGLYFLYAAVMGDYEDNVTDGKLAITVLLGLLTIPLALFLHKAARNGLRDAFLHMMQNGAHHGDALPK